MSDLKTRREWQEKYYGDMDEYNGMGYGRARGYRRGYGRPGAGYGPGNGPGRYYGWCPQPLPMPKYRYRRGYEADYDWWTDREEYDYQRNMMSLKRDLQNELRSVERINQRANQVADPQVRQLLFDLLQEANQQGMNVSQILQGLNSNNSPGMGIGSSLLDRLTGPFRGLDRRSLGWGAGAALLGLILMPSMAKSLRPLVRKTMEEVMDISERAQSVFSHAKEEFEDIVAEASFNKLKDSVSTQAGMASEKGPLK